MLTEIGWSIFTPSFPTEIEAYRKSLYQEGELQIELNGQILIPLAHIKVAHDKNKSEKNKLVCMINKVYAPYEITLQVLVYSLGPMLT